MLQRGSWGSAARTPGVSLRCAAVGCWERMALRCSPGNPASPGADEGGEGLEQIAQRGGGGPIPGNIQGQVGRGPEQPALLGDSPAHCRGVGIEDL